MNLDLSESFQLKKSDFPQELQMLLIKAGFETVEQLAYAKKEDLVKVRNLGEKSLKIIAAALGTKGVEFLAIK